MASSLIALVPARGGSKRVPGKNVRVLGGHPAIAYTISAARQSEVFAAVAVSTDDPEIAGVARHYGAEVPFLRPADLARDTSPDIEWVEFTLGRLVAQGRPYDAFSILRPTSPFRQSATIRRAWSEFKGRRDADSLRAIEKCRQHPGKMWVLEGEFMKPLLNNGPKDRPWHSTPYQALPEVYVQNASLEIAWADTVRRTHSIAGECIVPFLTQGHEGFDINDANDWWLAEELVRRGQAVLPKITEDPYV